jgi:tRNA-dihydrouridine synthase B
MNNSDAFQRFGIILNNRVIRTPVAIASMAGWVDAPYILARKAQIGAAFIGGYSIDEPTMQAAREMAAQGRKEFLYDNPIDELSTQIARMEGSDVVTGLNLRGSFPDSYRAVAETFGQRVLYEIDAHCRQEPMIRAGCGEFFLHHPDRLMDTVKALKSTGVTVSVKIRAGVHKDDRVLAADLWQAGADIIHVDLMDYGYQKLRQIRNSSPLFLIANNSITSFERMKEMFSYGADMVSLARRSDERTLAGLDAAITRFADEHGWYNAPKQLCRGGDIRALSFCCMPVKNCPLLPTLKKIGMTQDEYMALKMELVKGTPLEEGKQTCFGSLSWCCKDSSPCMFREMTIKQMGLTSPDYMRLKCELAAKLMKRLFHDKNHDNPG